MIFRSFAAPLVVSLLAFSGAARAQDPADCDQFKWSIARERAWFAASPKPVAAGATLLPGQAYVVALKPGVAATFVMAPEREPKPSTFGATLNVVIEKAGLYAITLSSEAWIDVIQHGARVKSTAFSGQRACPGVRKSVRFTLPEGPASVQISNVEGETIMVAIAPAP